MIRAVTAADADACARVYAPYVTDAATSFEETAPDAAELERRIAAVTAAYPWLVAERDGAVAGFAYGSRHRERAGYRWSCDVAVYVAGEHCGAGVGSALYGALLPELRERGLHVACAGIALPNAASVALHERFGFQPVGVYRGIGYKAGAWRDVGWWQLRLQPEGDGPPAEPRA